MSEEVRSVNQAAISNDYAVERVKPEDKQSALSVILVTTGFCIAMSGLFTGSAVAAGASLRTAIIAGLVGNAILTVYGGFMGIAGAREGVATSMLARHGFGREGSKIIGIMVAVVLLGWFSVQLGFFGLTINTMFPGGGFITNSVVAAGWGGLLMMLTAYFGYKGLNVLSYIAVPLLFVISGFGMVLAVEQGGGFGGVMAITPMYEFGMATAIVLFVGSFAAGATIQADITRYAKDGKTAVIACICGYMGGNFFTILAGFVTTLATGEGDLPAVMLALGLGIPALIVLVLAQWTTNDSNLYSASLGLSNHFNVSKKKIVIATGTIGIVLGMAGIADHFVGWLSILGIGTPPVAGIIIADYFVLKKMKYDFGPGTRYVAWNILAFVSWGAAFLFAFFVDIGVPSVNSIVIAFVLYVILMKTVGQKGVGLVGTSVE
ncbi:MAG: cytosine permease [Defluviitaleaceae bacterium]|nr:cytosine permease [Defluviitaleaceae bacterium]